MQVSVNQNQQLQALKQLPQQLTDVSNHQSRTILRLPILGNEENINVICLIITCQQEARKKTGIAQLSIYMRVARSSQHKNILFIVNNIPSISYSHWLPSFHGCSKERKNKLKSSTLGSFIQKVSEIFPKTIISYPVTHKNVNCYECLTAKKQKTKKKHCQAENICLTQSSGAVAQMLGCWISNPVVSSSKSLNWSGVDEMRTRNAQGLSGSE